MAEVEVAPDKVGLRLLKQSGETVTYQFAPGSTVGDVKRHAFSNFPEEWVTPELTDPGVLALLFKGAFLSDAATLESLKLKPGSLTAMHVLIRANNRAAASTPSPSKAVPEGAGAAGAADDGDNGGDGECCVIL